MISKKSFLSTLFFSAIIYNIQVYAFTGGNVSGEHDNKKNESSTAFQLHVDQVYTSCNLKGMHLDKNLFTKALIGFYNIKNSDNPLKKEVISIVDFEKPSTEKRLWVIDLKARKVLFYTLVAHGKNSGDNFTVNFSDLPNSNMSSLGFYLTRNTYQGKHGLSLIIDGLDKSYNHNAKARSIVIHGADYVSEDFIKCTGRLGRSHGCPAVPASLHKQIITAVEGGSVLFLYHPSKKYNSDFLNMSGAIHGFITSASI
jgi:hypothetical protein